MQKIAVLVVTVLGGLSVLSACQSSPPVATTAPTKPNAAAASPAASPTEMTMILSTPVPSPVACQIVAGFATMRDLVGASSVGSCLKEARQIPGNGNTEQRTTNGLFVLRALDARVLFVGADQSWIN